MMLISLHFISKLCNLIISNNICRKYLDINNIMRQNNSSTLENKLIGLIQFSPRTPAKIFIFLALANIMFVLATYWFSYLYHNPSNELLKESWFMKYFLVQFNLASENNIATWYSSMLIAMASFASLLCFTLDYFSAISSKEKLLSFGWLVFAFIFILLSLDELGSVHEMLGQLFYLNQAKDEKAGWIIVLTVPIILVAIFMIGFGLFKLLQNPKSFLFLIAGVIFYLINPVLEHFEMNILFNSSTVVDWYKHDLLIAIEECCEIFGTTFFIMYFLFYLIKRRDILIRNKQSISLSKSGKNIYLLSVTTIFIFIAIVFTFYLFFGSRLPKGDTGIALNWFPALFSFMAFLILLSTYNRGIISLYKSTILKRFLLLTFLFFSVFWGANLYPFLEWEGIGLYRFLAKGALMFPLLVTGIYLGWNYKRRLFRLGWFLFLFLLLLSIIISKQVIPIIGTFAGGLASFLLIISLFETITVNKN